MGFVVENSTNHTKEKKKDENISYIELTQKHMLFLASGDPVSSEDLRIGDAISTISGPSIVTSISTILRDDGVYNILTESGTVVINSDGVIASTYSSFLS